jgi:hypothetical protein
MATVHQQVIQRISIPLNILFFLSSIHCVGFVSSFGIRLKRVNRLPAPYGDCVEHGKTAEYIYRDKEYSTEV